MCRRSLKTPIMLIYGDKIEKSGFGECKVETGKI